jgi:hypothetical protein
MDDFDVGVFAVSIGILSIYHIALYSNVAFRTAPGTDIYLSTNIKCYKKWLIKHITITDAPTTTLAVQTLRNTILVAVFVGTQAFQFGYNTANGYSSLGDDQHREKMRTIILSILLFASFLCWVFVIRSAAHLGYMIAAIQQLPKVQVHESAVKTCDIEAVMDGEVKEVTYQCSAVESERKQVITASMKLLEMLIIYFRYLPIRNFHLSKHSSHYFTDHLVLGFAFCFWPSRSPFSAWADGACWWAPS